MHLCDLGNILLPLKNRESLLSICFEVYMLLLFHNIFKVDLSLFPFIYANRKALL